ncbi:sensor histidine kinase [Caldimonas brevitalea]|uniref:histidine kinase n=1 Tax=Caldimonas brevitalea TaxID=413882 RepID=A0A0G3BHU9_9BURK|nr:ATP-binding protein [Caldimonas brevitalea]AKJ26931.1 two-component system sensor kinase [Caldimonas brevitalea]
MTGLRRTPACQHRAGVWAWALGLMLMLMLMLQSAGVQAEPVQVRRAWITEAGPSGAREREVRLPDAWEHTAPRRDGAVRYRLDLPDAALQVERPALYLRRVGNIFRVHLNGQSVAEVGAYTRPLPNYNQQPQLVRLPQALVQPSGNRVEIEVIGAPRREAGLSTVWVGAIAELEPEYERAMDVQVRGAWLLASACATMGALGMLLAWRTQQSMYGWFAVANLVWAWRIAALSSHDAGIWIQALQWAFEMSYAVFVGAIAMFLLAMVGRDHTIGRQGLAAYIGITLVLSLANAVLNLPVLRTLHLLLTLLVTTAMAIYLAHYSFKERSRTGALLCLGALTGVAFGARDWIAFRLHHDYEAYTGARYAIVLLLFVMGWRLVEDYARTLVRLREMNRNLQDAVDHKQHELEQLFETRREIERQQATTAERDRILREMHDGLGGRLVGAIALAQQLGQQPPTEGNTLQELQLALGDCLTELRLSLDSLEADQRTLGEALAELRFRVEPSLRAAGIRLVWSVDDSAMSAELAAGATLQVLRIVREAFTNIIKHAEASVVRLTLRRETDWLELSVLDNGREQRPDRNIPRPAPLPSGKRGLSNMRTRAASLGAEIEIGPTAEGWGVQVRLPLA